jgi:hypothetical protein
MKPPDRFGLKTAEESSNSGDGNVIALLQRTVEIQADTINKQKDLIDLMQHTIDTLLHQNDNLILEEGEQT